MDEKIIDCVGLCCPEPIMITHKIAQTCSSGQTLVILATDPLAEEDFKSYCSSMGFMFIESNSENEVTKIKIEKK